MAAKKKEQKSQLQMDIPANAGQAPKLDEYSDESADASSIEVKKAADEASAQVNLEKPRDPEGNATSDGVSDAEAPVDDDSPGETMDSVVERSDALEEEKKIGWEGNRVFILMTSFDLSKFEHWIRLGLIHPELEGADYDGSFQGVCEIRGVFPIAANPVPFEVLIEVGLTAEEHADLLWDSDHQLGWMVPGVLPVHRIQHVLFSSPEALQKTVERLKQGAVVPDALSSYLKVWSVQDTTEGHLPGDVVHRLNALSAQIPEKSLIRERIKDWEELYGQLSFLRSISLAKDGFTMSVVGLNQLHNVFRDRWKEFEQIYASAKDGFAWSTSTWMYELLIILEQAGEYSNGNPDAPDILNQFITDDSQRAEKIEMVKLWLACDAWWGSRIAEDAALERPFQVILDWMKREDVLLELRTEALMVLSRRALRMNYDSKGASPKRARTRNFKLGEQDVEMTWRRGDAMNELMSECCWAVINEKEFELEMWGDHLEEINRDSILSENEDSIVLFGMRMQKTQITEHLYRFVRDSVNSHFLRAKALNKNMRELQQGYEKRIEELESQLANEREMRHTALDDIKLFCSDIQKKLLG